MSVDIVRAGTVAPPRGLRLLAQGAFWFFLLKGLAWLVVPALLVVAAS